MQQNWKHKDLWSKRSKNFTVEISRHTKQVEYPEGPNCWCVYAYIFPKHPHYAEFVNDHMFQDAAAMMPMHGGPSLLQWLWNGEKKIGVKVGCDYQHLHDDHFQHYAKEDDAYEVFHDAEDLFQWLAARELKD